MYSSRITKIMIPIFPSCSVQRKIFRVQEQKRRDQHESSREQYIISDKIGSVTTIGINLPEKKNNINSAVVESLAIAIDTFENDGLSNAAVLYGIGGNFCSGVDESEDSSDLLSIFHYPISKKVIVAGISGYATSVGFELALLCDLRVVEDTAVLGLNSRKCNHKLSKLSCKSLVNMVGISRALQLILTGGNITGSRAFELGIANRLVACGTGMGQGLALAKSVAKFSQKELLSDRKNTYLYTE